MNKIIAEHIGQTNLCSKFCSSDSLNSILVVESEIGTGKSELCKEIKKQWKIHDSDIVFVLNAAENPYYEPLAPFFAALSEYNDYTPNVLKNIITEGSNDIPFIGNTASAIFKHLFSDKKIGIKGHRFFDYFNEQEEYILKLIYTFIKENNSLFICDDVDRWDNSSLRLLNIMLNKKIDNDAFDSISYVITAEHLPKGLEVPDRSIFTLSPVSRTLLPDIIREINFALTYNTEIIDTIFSITGGNLQLIIDCCDIMDCLKDVSGNLSFYSIVKQRIENSSLNHLQIIKLLQLSSVIGMKFKKALLHHFTKSEHFDFDSILNETIQLNFLREDNKDISFVRKMVYDCFYENLGNDKYKYHIQLENSLKFIWPALYETRAHNLFYGKDYNNAIKLYVIYLLKFLRENGYEMVVENDIYTKLVQHKYFDYYQNMRDAYISYFNGDFRKAYNIIMMMDSDIIEFVFEIDYLFALICTNMYFDANEFNDGIVRLKKWDDEDFKENYTEMWLRSSILLLDYEFEMNIQPDGKNRLINIQRIIDRKSFTDISIRKLKYDMLLKSNFYSKVERAYYETNKALKYFSSDIYRNLHKYYIALLNHSGNEMVLGEYMSSFQHTVEAINLVRNMHGVCFTKREVLINNHVISGYLSDNYNANECLEMLYYYYEKLDDFADELLINNNITVFMALSNDLETALELSEKLYSRIEYMDDIDIYYWYYIVNNYVVLLYLNKKNNNINTLLEKLTSSIPLDNDKYYFSERNKLLKKIINNNVEIDTNTQGWNDIITTKYPHKVGQAWEFWSKLLLFSDLQVWSDC